MTASPLEPLRRVFGDRLDELTGSVVSGEIPLTADVVNRFIASKLTRPDVPIVSAEVVIHDHDVRLAWRDGAHTVAELRTQMSLLVGCPFRDPAAERPLS